MKTNQFKLFQWLFIMSFMVMAAACEKTDLPSEDPEPEAGQAYKVGDILYQRFGKETDGQEQIIEEVADSVVNFGTEDQPALFPVNIRHTVMGENVAPGPADLQCVFQSLTYEEYLDFADVFAEYFGLPTSKDRKLSAEERPGIFIKMKEKIGGLKGHPALVYYFLKSEFKEDARVKNLLTSDVSRDICMEFGMPVNSADEFPSKEEPESRAINKNLLPREVRSTDVANIFGGFWCPIDEPYALSQVDTYQFLKSGKEYVEYYTPPFNYRNDFMALWQGDIFYVDHYDTDAKSQNTETYFFYHGTSLTPLSGAKFHIHQEYGKYSYSFTSLYDVMPESGAYTSGYWTKQLKMVVEEAWRWPEQYCEGFLSYYGAYMDMEAAKNGLLKPKTHSMTVKFEYGDKVLCHYIANLKFNVKDANMTLEYNYIDHR